MGTVGVMVLVAVLVMASTAGCTDPSPIPGELGKAPKAASIPASTSATDTEEAEAYKKGEEATRAYIARDNAAPMTPTPANLALATFTNKEKWFIDLVKRDGGVIRTSVILLSVRPVSYFAAPIRRAIIVTCQRLAGGIYDENDKNITVSPKGKPQSDKPRLVEMRYSLVARGPDHAMLIESSDLASVTGITPQKPCTRAA